MPCFGEMAWRCMAGASREERGRQVIRRLAVARGSRYEAISSRSSFGMVQREGMVVLWVGECYSGKRLWGKAVDVMGLGEIRNLSVRFGTAKGSARRSTFSGDGSKRFSRETLYG